MALIIMVIGSKYMFSYAVLLSQNSLFYFPIIVKIAFFPENAAFLKTFFSSKTKWGACNKKLAIFQSKSAIFCGYENSTFLYKMFWRCVYTNATQSVYYKLFYTFSVFNKIYWLTWNPSKNCLQMLFLEEWEFPCKQNMTDFD